MIDRKTIREGDEVFVAHTGYYSGEPYAHVYGGVVVAAGEDGSFCYRTADGRVDNVPAWNVVSCIAATEAECWMAAASRLATIAAEVAEKAAECRAKAAVEVVA
jgi:hypothetical protein